MIEMIHMRWKGDGGEVTEMNLKELVNPCSKMREDIEERRESERLQDAGKMKEVDILKENNIKRTLVCKMTTLIPFLFWMIWT